MNAAFKIYLAAGAITAAFAGGVFALVPPKPSFDAVAACNARDDIKFDLCMEWENRAYADVSQNWGKVTGARRNECIANALGDYETLFYCISSYIPDVGVSTFPDFDVAAACRNNYVLQKHYKNSASYCMRMEYMQRATLIHGWYEYPASHQKRCADQAFGYYSAMVLCFNAIP
jgi:hypothetical protein